MFQKKLVAKVFLVEVPQRSVKILNQKYLKAVLKVAKSASSNKSHPIPSHSQNSSVIFYILSLQQKLCRDFLSKYLFLERGCTNL